VVLVGLIKHHLPGREDGLCAALMDAGGRQHADATVPVLMVVPVEIATAEAPRANNNETLQFDE